MKLIIGLGNPGNKYQLTLHNIGFMFINYFLDFFLDSKITQKYQSQIHHINIGKNEALLIKPQTYMNLSGYAVKNIINHYKISLDNILVIVDDIYLKEGVFKLKIQGGHGGHNGLKNIIDVLNNKNFKRLKIGVDYDKFIPLEQYLLTTINNQKKDLICRQFPLIKDIVTSFIKDVAWDKLLNLYLSK